MKVNNLRKIIRESIKELMNEQTGVYHRWQGKYQQMSNGCYSSGTANIIDGTGQAPGSTGYNDPQSNQAFYVMVGSPQLGQFINTTITGPMAHPDDVHSCWEYLGTSLNPSSTVSVHGQGNAALGIIEIFGIHNNCLDCFPINPPPPPPPPPPTPLVAGCNVLTSSNYDMYADGCEVNGIIDPNDVTCCVQTQPGGGVTPTDIEPTMVTPDRTKNDPNVTQDNPQVRRMRELANIRK